MDTRAIQFFAGLPMVIGAIGRIRRDQKRRYALGRVSRKTAAVSKRLHKYVDPCMKRYGNPAYCWRVAWSIYCSHVNPKYPGCTKYGKRWGKPYSKRRSLRGIPPFLKPPWMWPAEWRKAAEKKRR